MTVDVAAGTCPENPAIDATPSTRSPSPAPSHHHHRGRQPIGHGVHHPRDGDALGPHHRERPNRWERRRDSNAGALLVTDSTLSNNSASNGYGGGISNAGTLTVTDSTLSNNSAPNGDGGGIANLYATLTVTDSTLSNNSALDGDGGGIYNAGTLTVTDSTLSNNSAPRRRRRDLNGHTLTVTDSTLSNNSAPAGGGGGIANGDQVTLGATIIANSRGQQLGQFRHHHRRRLQHRRRRILRLNATGSILGATSSAPRSAPGRQRGTDRDHPARGRKCRSRGDSNSTVVNNVPVCPATDQRGISSTPGEPCDIGSVQLPVGPASQLALVTSPGSSTNGTGLRHPALLRHRRRQRQRGHRVDATVTLALATGSPAGTLSGCTETTTAGVATFSGCAITGTAGNYTLSASRTGLTAVDTASFALTRRGGQQAGPGHLAGVERQRHRLRHPAHVRHRRPGGNVVTTSTAPVTLALATGSPAGTLSGCTETTTAGVATFSGCAGHRSHRHLQAQRLDRPG